MVALYKDPHGRSIFESVAATTQVRPTEENNYGKNTIGEGHDDSELTILRERVTQLEEMLKLQDGRKECSVTVIS